MRPSPEIWGKEGKNPSACPNITNLGVEDFEERGINGDIKSASHLLKRVLGTDESWWWNVHQKMSRENLHLNPGVIPYVNVRCIASGYMQRYVRSGTSLPAYLLKVWRFSGVRLAWPKLWGDK
ncbi:hypothetical protein CEXT_578331 [Caerostris extrusa]|uniref:Uncharacterized protein n=1 Tax=Caerostris extrusa TaxID=172846 RepID=A0AAV4TGN6_CAEEX|nr:hypothetical protein CEXT_578331 [Caerostris extrusa]